MKRAPAGTIRAGDVLQVTGHTRPVSEIFDPMPIGAVCEATGPRTARDTRNPARPVTLLVGVPHPFHTFEPTWPGVRTRGVEALPRRRR